MDLTAEIAAVITGVFGIIIVLMQRESLRRTKTNHGKVLGQHVEDLVLDVHQHRLVVQQIASDLSLFKLEQAEDREADRRQIAEYVVADALAHEELRKALARLEEEKGTNGASK